MLGNFIVKDGKIFLVSKFAGPLDSQEIDREQLSKLKYTFHVIFTAGGICVALHLPVSSIPPPPHTSFSLSLSLFFAFLFLFLLLFFLFSPRSLASYFPAPPFLPTTWSHLVPPTLEPVPRPVKVFLTTFLRPIPRGWHPELQIYRFIVSQDIILNN